MDNHSPQDHFIHDPLPGATSHLRLLYILSDDGTQVLRCRTEVFELSGSIEQEYVAILYTWGSPQQNKTIQVNDRPFQVTSNAYYALWQMQHYAPKSWSCFWIDSICINQDDHNEKSQQVGVMHEIHTNARCTASCRGEVSKEDTAAVAEFLNQDPSMLDFTYWSWPVEPQDWRWYQSRDRWQAVMKILDNKPYFQRAWVTQELLLAKSVFIFAGATAPIHEKLLRRWDQPTSCSMLFEERERVERSPDRGTSSCFTVQRLVPMFGTSFTAF